MSRVLRMMIPAALPPTLKPARNSDFGWGGLWLTLSLFAYFAVLCVVHVDWAQFFLGLVWPRLNLEKEFWLMVAAILGTTISPYLFFWQAAHEVEDTKTEPIRKPLLQRPKQAANALARIRPELLNR